MPEIQKEWLFCFSAFWRSFSSSLTPNVRLRWSISCLVVPPKESWSYSKLPSNEHKGALFWVTLHIRKPISRLLCSLPNTAYLRRHNISRHQFSLSWTGLRSRLSPLDIPSHFLSHFDARTLAKHRYPLSCLVLSIIHRLVRAKMSECSSPCCRDAFRLYITFRKELYKMHESQNSHTFFELSYSW